MVRITTPRGYAEVEAGAPFAETVKRVADEKEVGARDSEGHRNFRVILGGTEIVDPEQAPATIEEGAELVLFPFDKAG